MKTCLFTLKTFGPWESVGSRTAFRKGEYWPWRRV